MARSNYSIEIINPNSSQSVTNSIKKELQAPCQLLNVNISVTQIDAAPAAIESDEDVRIAEELTIKKVQSSPADVCVIACFSDPAVEKLRKTTDRLIFGIAESSFYSAASLGETFGILSILDASVTRHALQVKKTGLLSRLAGDLALNLGVLELANEKVARPRIENTGRSLRDNHKADVLILGCAGMGNHRQRLQNLLEIPVIDPCWAGVVAALNALGISDKTNNLV